LNSSSPLEGLIEICEYCDSHEHSYINSFKVPHIRMAVW